MTGGGAGAGCLRSRDGPGRPPSASSPHSPPPPPALPTLRLGLSLSGSRCSFAPALAARPCPRLGLERASRREPHATRDAGRSAGTCALRAARRAPVSAAAAAAPAAAAARGGPGLRAGPGRGLGCSVQVGVLRGGRGPGDTQTPAPPRPRGKVARVVAAAASGRRAGGSTAVGLAHGAPCPATCGCHKSGGFVRLPRPGCARRKLQGARAPAGLLSHCTFSLKFQPRGFGRSPPPVCRLSPGSASPRDGFGVG